MFRNYLNTGFDNGCGFNIPNGNSIFLVRKSAITGTTITDGQLVNISALTNWIKFEKIQNLNYETISNFSRNGWIYTTEVSFVVPEISVLKNRLFDYLKEDIISIFQDRNGKFWLIGLQQTATISGYDYDSGSGEYMVKLASTHKQKLVLVSSNLPETLPIVNYDICGFSLTGIRELSAMKADSIQSVVIKEDSVVRIDITAYPFNLKGLDDIYFKVTPTNSKNGIVNNIQLGFTIDGLTIEKNELLERLTNTQLIFIATDKNGRTWMIGYPSPMLLSEAGFGTTEANYKYVFSSTQKQNILQINKNAFQIVEVCNMQYVDSNYVDCDYVE
ncbi:hypothetical protein [Xanthocytophaga agilis]|uniref:Uncharacterized protein n=1 Tax=Xanthocytophaga agilis TaxID=3048010 RepID=A0AAE3QZ04_9BACT|nr:hypothetical protein [Xanthocytophaga agilis]MDJ1500646.1 hypothetical protein [Xanthocytophaga agilis]